jgi:alpha-N-arabinofuranosidase
MKNIISTVVFFLFVNVIFAQQLEYSNPILGGFYPDPSICRVGNDYYLVNSSFAYYPGLPIFHSNDLVNWKQIGNAMNRPEQMDLTGAGVSRGLFAPAIRYHDGLFYITCTLVDKGGNFVITAKDPKGPWSNPVWIPEARGIDPSLFFDDDGKSYFVYNGPPEGKPLNPGHRTIRIFEFDTKDLKVTGDSKILVNGGTDISKKPVWIEGPHIYKKNDWYYLMCAEGGTGYDHSEVVFRSKNAEGPYVSYENNPILTQRDLDSNRVHPITSTGHADLIETTTGKWCAVFLGCRPYEGDYYNTGRETFMAPVEWRNDWPVIIPASEEVKYHYSVPMPGITKKVFNPFNGNLIYRDEFDQPKLNGRWIFLRTVKNNWYSLSEKKGFLTLHLQPLTCSEKQNPSFIAHRQENLKCTVTTLLQFSPASENEKAGLTIFQNETHFYYLCKSVTSNKPVVQLYQSNKDSTMDLLTSMILPPSTKEIQLRIIADGPEYSFFYSIGNNQWILLKEDLDGKFLSTKEAGGFVGSVFGLYATSLGKESHSKAYYNRFEYKGDDDVFKTR